MEKQALLYIVTPIALLFIVYLLVVTISWPVARRHTFVPFYLLLLLIVFPPAFIFFMLWFYIIHLGLLTSVYYIRDPTVQGIQTQTIPQRYPQQGTLSQRERRISSGSSRV
jgi:phosphatidylserine synthase